MLLMLQIEHGTSESTEKRQEYHAKLAGLYTQLQQPGDAKKHLEPLLHGKLAYSDDKSRLHAACQMADVQVCSHQSCMHGHVPAAQPAFPCCLCMSMRQLWVRKRLTNTACLSPQTVSCLARHPRLRVGRFLPDKQQQLACQKWTLATCSILVCTANAGLLQMLVFCKC